MNPTNRKRTLDARSDHRAVERDLLPDDLIKRFRLLRSQRSQSEKDRRAGERKVNIIDKPDQSSYFSLDSIKQYFSNIRNYFLQHDKHDQQIKRRVDILEEELQQTRGMLDEIRKEMSRLQHKLDSKEEQSIRPREQETKELEDFVYHPPALKNSGHICFINSYINSLLSFLDMDDIKYWEEQHKKFEQENQANQENQLSLDNEKKKKKIIYDLQKDLIAIWKICYTSDQKETTQLKNCQSEIAKYHRNFLYDLQLFAHLQDVEGAGLIKSVCNNLQSEEDLELARNDEQKKHLMPRFVIGDPSDLWCALEKHLFDQKMQDSFTLYREEKVTIDIGQETQSQLSLPKSNFTYTESVKASCLHNISSHLSPNSDIAQFSEVTMRSFSENQATELGYPLLQYTNQSPAKLDTQYFVTPETKKFLMQIQSISWDMIKQHAQDGFPLALKTSDILHDQTSSSESVKNIIFKPFAIICYVNSSHYITVLLDENGKIQTIQDDDKVTSYVNMELTKDVLPYRNVISNYVCYARVDMKK